MSFTSLKAYPTRDVIRRAVTLLAASGIACQPPVALPHADAPHRPQPDGTGGKQPEGQSKDGEKECDGEKDQKIDGFERKKVPPVMPTPRYGDYWISPGGPGYYSLVDLIRGDDHEKPPHLPYGKSGLMAHAYYDADFRYLDDPKNTQTDLFDFLKRRHPFGNEKRVVSDMLIGLQT